MKNITIRFHLFAVVLLLSACNIKAPINDLLWEENVQLANELVVVENDTSSTLEFILPFKVTFDSITCKTLKVNLVNTSNKIRIDRENENADKLHLINIWRDSKHASLVAFNSKDTTNSKIKFKSFLNNVIFVSSETTPSKVIVLWQNTIVPTRFFEIEKNGISIFIPKEAKNVVESTIRVFIVNNSNKIEKLNIHLLAGQPVQ